MTACLDELRSIKELNLAVFPGSPREDLESAAFAVAETRDAGARKRAVEAAVRCARQHEAGALELLAWLLVYKVVAPLQVLQAIVYTGDQRAIEICGTNHFEKDSLRHLKVKETIGRAPRFAVAGENESVMVDFLSVETNPSPRTTPSRRQQTDQAVLNRKSEQDQVAELTSKVKGIVMGSMSAHEIAHRIAHIASKKTSPEIVNTLVQCCINEKAYNRLYGNILYKLGQQSSLWAELAEHKFADLYSEASEDLDTNQINTVGSLFGHLLGVNAVDWSHIFSSISLNPSDSTPSNRILVQAVMQEARREVGVPAIEKRAASPSLRTAAAAAFTGEFAAQFWEAVGFPRLAELVDTDESGETSQ